MKKTSKKVDVLKHFNDEFDARVKKFMDGGTAGVVNNYNDIKYGTGGANPGTGKSYMSGNPAPAFKKGGMKKYQTGGTKANPRAGRVDSGKVVPQYKITVPANKKPVSDTANANSDRYQGGKIIYKDGKKIVTGKYKSGGNTKKKK